MSVAAHLDEAEKQILGALLADFSDRALTADQLTSGYQGPQVADLMAAICAGGDITQVDFDVAFFDIEKKKLIVTGPYASYENNPGSGVIFIGGYSKREYAGLTQLGYKVARQSPNRPTKVHRVVNNVHISGGQFSNLQLSTGDSVTQRMDSTSGVDSEILMRLVAILEKRGQVISLDQRKDLALALEEASSGNGKQAKSILEKVCGPAWESVQPVMWPIVGEIVKKSLGL